MKSEQRRGTDHGDEQACCRQSVQQSLADEVRQAVLQEDDSQTAGDVHDQNERSDEVVRDQSVPQASFLQ
jgi:hypothetical protein